MFQRLNEEYKERKVLLESPEIGKFCVAYDALDDKFHRVQIKKLKPQRVILKTNDSNDNQSVFLI